MVHLSGSRTWTTDNHWRSRERLSRVIPSYLDLSVSLAIQMKYVAEAGPPSYILQALLLRDQTSL
jgi:hypothetical protein